MTIKSLSDINLAYHMDENQSVQEHLDIIALTDDAKKRIREKARGYIQSIRDNRRKFGGLDKFLQEFGLSTKEGIALMCLAEALLRIPDNETADKLIRDKIGGDIWDQHLGKADDLFVNASTWALMLTGHVIGDVDDNSQTTISNFASKMVSKLGEPVVRAAMLHAMKIMGKQFVMGRTIKEALETAIPAEEIGYRHSYDMLGEGARTKADAERYFQAYVHAIDAIGKAANDRGIHNAPGISVKLSAIHPRYDFFQQDICIPELSKKLLHLAQLSAKYGVGLTVDAEEAHRLEISLQIIENVFTDPSLKGYEGLGIAIQAYQKRCTRVVDFLSHLCETTGRKMMVRLVKGAYWDTEIKYAQVNGLSGYPVFTRKSSTDVSYLANAAKLLARRDLFYPMFATHNAHTVAAIIELAGNDQTGFEFQRLHGMGEPLYHQIVGLNDGEYPCRVYAPVGNHQDLLPYLVRRLLENGANSSFVNRLQDDKVPIDEMLTDPIDYISAIADKPHPKIPLPEKLYEDRKNAKGMEFANTAVSDDFLKEVKKFTKKTYTVCPIIQGKKLSGDRTPVLNPADHHHIVGAVTFATADQMRDALDSVHGGYKTWHKTPASLRAECLKRMADQMEIHMAELIALCIVEAGKTIPDALADVREAIDFCRYYAVQGEKLFDPKGMLLSGPTGETNRLLLEGRGTFLCISPWNFPLAIFMGQISAALMAGNTVIAKPAEQTSLIAMRAVEMLLECGVPDDAIALLPADGALTGKTLLSDPRIKGVCFTGSTDVALLINRALAARDGAITPLIAETGGQNAMIVDSSALPEQIVDDVLVSSFRSAGQRCSALRVLFLHEGIADKVIDMLSGAAQELILGQPIDLASDIGPVIDDDARQILIDHAKYMDTTAKKIAEVPLPHGLENGTFFAPRAYEIKDLSELTREVFGPILHVIRYKNGTLDDVVDQINDTGYGLTFGLHTRIDHTMRDLTDRIHVGNCYVNRSMIGAVVGVQPFGGHGLSGTGPKAGGPHYLTRFANEKTITTNTTASGGNTTLVSLAED